MIMLYLDYSENGVITSCIPMIKHAEKKLVSAVSPRAVGVFVAIIIAISLRLVVS